MPGMRLAELIGMLRRGGLDLTAEDVADAVWLAGRIGAAPPGEVTAGPRPPVTPEPDPPSGGPGRAPDPPAPGPARRRTPEVASTPVPLHTTGRVADVASDGARSVFPVRAPAASALPGLLGLEKALRTLGRYRVAAPHPRGERIDEEATAERAAASGVLLPVIRHGRRHRCDVQLLMDTGPAMAVWGQLVEELRQACQQSGAFASVRVHHLYADASGTPVVGTTAGPGGHTRLRGADELHDPTGRRLTLVISDCVGPLWQNGTAQRLLHSWPRTAPLAVIQPLPPRLWGRTPFPAEPGVLVRAADVGGRISFVPDEQPWQPPAADARPVPVLPPTPEAFEAWARLLSGTGPTRENAWAARTGPGAAPAPAAAVERTDDERLRAFRAGASPGALRLAVYLAAAPLTLPVMQLVQRAMLPDTGPAELAEVLLGGLLRQLPGTEEHPCFVYEGGLQELLLTSLGQDTAGLVLKHCSAYVERHFGKGTRNFAALAAARLDEADPGPEHVRTGYAPQGAGDGAEAELFARIPARVLRFYLPQLVTPEPLAEAERLLEEWRQLADPDVLRLAREQAEAVVTPARGGPVREPADAVRARLLLGRILRAEAGTAGARTGGRQRELLHDALGHLDCAYRSAPPDGAAQAEAALELAACRRDLWLLTAQPEQLSHALAVLDPHSGPWPDVSTRARTWSGRRTEQESPPAHVTAHHSRLRLRGSLLIDLDRPGEAVPELREACAYLEAAATDDAVLSRVLLDLAGALRSAGADATETVDALVRAERAAGDDPVLRLPCLVARAAFHDGRDEFAAADEAYETAVMLAPADSARRSELLVLWGESLLRRASARDGARIVDRAENVLREALTSLPARSAQRGRLQGLVGSALAQRFRHLGFLPDLFESRHLLGQAVRVAADAAVRSEVWLQLGRVRLEGWYRAGTPVLAEALQAYENAEREAVAAYGTDPGSVVAARARHGCGATLGLMGRPSAARAAYRAAWAQWQRMVGALREVDWADVELTRGMTEGPLTVGETDTPGERWRTTAPPWWPWTAEWSNVPDADWS